jgi:hypothetical protein
MFLGRARAALFSFPHSFPPVFLNNHNLTSCADARRVRLCARISKNSLNHFIMKAFYLCARIRARAILLLLLFLSSFQFFAQTPNCSLAAPAMACVGQDGVVHITTSGTYDVQWDVPGQQVLQFDNTMAMIHWINAGTATIVATLYAPGGQNPLGSCSVTTEIVPKPSPQIVPFFLGSCSIAADGRLFYGFCENKPVKFIAQVGAGSQVTWQVNGVLQPLSGAVLEINSGNVGSLQICATETNAAGCTATICETYDVFANPTVFITELTAGDISETSVCRGEQLLFQGHINDPNDLGGKQQWGWEIFDANTNALLGGGNMANFPYTFNTAGDYIVRLHGYNCLGCEGIDDVLVHVNAAEIPEIICPSVVCQSGEPVQYCTTVMCDQLQWQVNGGTLIGDPTQNCIEVIWNNPPASGYGSVTLTVGSCQGSVCTLPTTVEVPIIPSQVVIDGPTSICSADAQPIFSVPSWPGATYLWTVSDPQFKCWSNSHQ